MKPTATPVTVRPPPAARADHGRRLRAYRLKRELTATGEPDEPAPAPASAAPQFVIQKHAARQLHYDFRLAIAGTLKSWAVPRGPPFQAGAKTLAIEVEDHPLAYASFEGVIPAGHYGAGTVMVWDRGTFALIGDDDPLQAFHAGKIHLVLHGEKCRGEWTLVRLPPRRPGKPHWLLLKNRRGPGALAPTGPDRSVLTGRTFDEIERAAPPRAG